MTRDPMSLSPRLLVLRNAEVFAPEKLGRMDLLVAAGEILAIEGTSSNAWAALDPALVETVDLAGARVCPGFVDAHVHLTGGGGESGPSSRVPRVLFSELTRAGVTTCVGVLGTDGTTRSVESLVSAVQGLRAEGLDAYAWTGSYEIPVVTLTGSVRRDMVYVDSVVGVGEVALSDHRSSQPTFDELARLAADCHVGGLMSGKAGVLHLHLGDGPRGLALVRRILDETELPARVFYPTHVNRKTRLFDEALDLARLADVFGDGTLETRERFATYRWKLLEDPDGVEKVIGSLRQLARQHPTKKKLKQELAYFRRNKARMTYFSWREQGLPIGSGVVEAACKTLVSQRLKLSGMRWSDEGAQAILRLRGWQQSDLFDHAWALLAATFRSDVTLVTALQPLRSR